jgi:hypothetical protein
MKPFRLATFEATALNVSRWAIDKRARGTLLRAEAPPNGRKLTSTEEKTIT